MELIFRICLFIAGVVNLIPSILVLAPAKIQNSYGIQIPDSNYELLLRHRAVLFAVVGGIMIYSVITKKNYSLAVLVGIVSMLSFIILYHLIPGELNAQLSKVMKVDIVALAILLVGFALFKLKAK